VVTLRTTRFNIQKFVRGAGIAFMCFARISQQTAYYPIQYQVTGFVSPRRRVFTARSLIGAFVKLRKTTISLVMSVPPSAWNNSALIGRICMKFDVWICFEYYYYWYSALGPVWVETRVQSGDWYGSGTLHHGQVLRGSLPLFSPAF